MVKYRSEELFRALGTPARVRMVERLSQKGPQSISQMAKPLRISLPGALKHTKILEEAGILVCRKEGRVQYCRINSEAFDALNSWLLTQKIYWERSFDRLEKHLINRKKNK